MSKKWIVGLGNPGAKYAGTRHNVGFMVIDRIVEQAFQGAEFREKHDSLYLKATHAGVPLMLLKPSTFMNLSGSSVVQWKGKEGLNPETDLLVIYDDMDLPLGRLRLRFNGSGGSHNGMDSMISSLGSSDFARLRLGVGKPLDPAEWADYVLKKFKPEEKPEIAKTIQAAADAALAWLEVGDEKSRGILMSKVNG